MPRVRPSHLRRGSEHALDGRIVADFGHHVLVEDAAGHVHPCTVRKRKLRAVCGDRVRWQPESHGGRGIVESLLPRVNALTRPDSRGEPDTLAANLDQLIIVCAVAPPLDANLIDRYLMAAAAIAVAAVIVCNKTELAVPPDESAGEQSLTEYAAIPYPVVRTSVVTGQGLDRLAVLCRARTSVLVGQSGVGKSSLLNALGLHSDAAVGAVSAHSGEGTHTTSASRLYSLPGGGEIIDSPGVREYTPYLERDWNPIAGFPEFLEPSRTCRFRNCRHLNEPGCGVKTAVERALISSRRYASYRVLAGEAG